MKANIKYRVIYHNKDKFNIRAMCNFFEVSKSGYYDWIKRINEHDKDMDIGELIRQCQEKTHKTYGYRRIKLWLLRKTGFVINHKAILRIMNKYGLLSVVRRRRQYINYNNKIHRYNNILNRNFIAAKPNEKWVTDISYIFSKQGVLYLSVIKDLFDNFIVSYKIGTEHNVNLVTQTINQIKKEVAIGTVLHSDQGFQYTSREYFNLTKEYNITLSMSRMGTPLDNAPVENFFGILKAECIHIHKPLTNADARRLIEEYIEFYNYQRIQLKSKLTPYEIRCQLLDNQSI